MSCMMTNAQTLSTLADYIEALANMGFNYFGMELPQPLREELADCADRYDFVNGQKVYARLHQLNARACAGRYSRHNEPAELFPLDPYQPRLGYQPPQYSDHTFAVAPWHFQMAKRLDFFIYQCSEDATRNDPLLSGLNSLRQALFAFIVQHSADYAAHPWGA